MHQHTHAAGSQNSQFIPSLLVGLPPFQVRSEYQERLGVCIPVIMVRVFHY